MSEADCAPEPNRAQLLTILRAMHNQVINLRGTGQRGAQDRTATYLEWTTTATERLSRLLRTRDLDHLIQTPACGRLLSTLGFVLEEADFRSQLGRLRCSGPPAGADRGRGRARWVDAIRE